MSVQTDDEVESSSRAGADATASARGSTFEQILGSFPLQLAAAGLVFIAIGYVLNTGVWAGIFPIWGVALVVIGLGSFFFIRYAQRGTQG